MITGFERDTDTLSRPEIKQQIIDMNSASRSLNHGDFSQSNKLFQGKTFNSQQLASTKMTLSTSPTSKSNSKSLCPLFTFRCNRISALVSTMGQYIKIDVEPLRAFLSELNQLIQRYHSEDSKGEDDQDLRWAEAQQIKIKVLTVFLQLYCRDSAKQFSQMPAAQLEQLLSLLEVYPESLQEVSGKLCGCKDLAAFKNSFEQEKLLKDQKYTDLQKAKLLNAASDWLLISGSYERSLKCKQITLSLWRACNRLNEHDKALSQIRAMKAQKGQHDSEKDPYLMKISKIAQVLSRISGHLNKKQVKVKAESGVINNLIVSKMIPKTVKKLEIEEPDDNKIAKGIFGFVSSKEKLKSSQLKKSILGQKEKFDLYHERCSEFNQEYRKETNNQITSLLHESKYLKEQAKAFQMLTKCIGKKWMLTQRQLFNQIKFIKVVKQGILDQNFLSGLGNVKENQSEKGSKGRSSKIDAEVVSRR